MRGRLRLACLRGVAGFDDVAGVVAEEEEEVDAVGSEGCSVEGEVSTVSGALAFSADLEDSPAS